MIEGDIKQDEVFRHIRTGVEYIILNCNEQSEQTLAKFSEAPHGEGWESAVTYYDPLRHRTMFVITEEHFRNSFERVE